MRFAISYQDWSINWGFPTQIVNKVGFSDNMNVNKVGLFKTRVSSRLVILHLDYHKVGFPLQESQ